ncbi:hypothetical protein QTO31_16675 [Chloroflexus sp. MS-CIW-1]|jgi:hypothetical protein|uniref:hypothetical protein n=1 Tax=Chloroflexus sp. MS-CIW-1 TaxID=3055768 RepID=UPI0026491161|nr:hypothetical protein [Chloroflexus sp. MS-CIW-1]MDN5273601.1 hypothetical protein [Chloroflexus sp. MS-CIW-1]
MADNLTLTIGNRRPGKMPHAQTQTSDVKDALSRQLFSVLGFGTLRGLDEAAHTQTFVSVS